MDGSSTELFDIHSDVAEALLGFLEDSSLFSLDDILEQDVVDAPIPPAFANAGEGLAPPPPNSFDVCSDCYIQGQPQPPPPPLLDSSMFFYPQFSPTMSVQTVAARERRKRISSKLLELGRIIPGGDKMNTAEMLSSAFKYVKFLQVQVSILQLMASIPESRSEQGHLHGLVTSTVIQEKLSAEGLCLVLNKMIDPQPESIEEH